MSKMILIAVFTSFFMACQRKEAIDNKSIAHTIDSLAERDQRAIAQTDSAGQEQKEQFAAEQKIVLADNCKIVKEIFNAVGYPGSNKIGEESSHNFWLIVQHSDHDVEFQQQVLEKMKTEVANKNASALDWAYLTDRVNINRGLPQVYGTQVIYEESGEVVPKPLHSPSSVDSLRASVGLEPLRNYLSLMKALRAKPGDKIEIIVQVPK